MAKDDRTEPHEMAFDSSGPVSGEAPLPDEHTARVRARQSVRSDPAPTNHKVHDATQAQAAAQKSSSELAEPSRRERRKKRDSRAEKRAIQILLAVFVGLGGLGLVAVNLLIEDDVSPEPIVDTTEDPVKRIEPSLPKRPPGVFSTTPTEEVDVPALRQMRTEGLTIATEGLPEVLTEDVGPAVAPMAALETCRFAYGVWEFSPNRRFRFMTTCEALQGQVLVGAYEVRGGKVHMSPLTTRLARIVSVFDVERPSMMTTTVDSLLKGKVMFTFTVNQRVTVMRAGMEGDGFHSNYTPKNTVGLPELLAPDLPLPRRGAAPPTPSPSPTKTKPAGGKDPLLDLLKGSK